MLHSGGATARSVINRAYYSIFYAVLALFLKCGIRAETSKHAGIITVFDREFVRTGRIDKEYSRILHLSFDSRQEFDYKEFTTASPEQAASALEDAEKFLRICELTDPCIP